HVWVHDYRSLYRGAGLQCATFVLPEKVGGLQQKLFIAAERLSPVILALEQEVAAPAANATSGSSSLGRDAMHCEPLPDAVRWPEQMQTAIRELRETIPAGTTFILVNDDQWGNQPSALNGYRVFPFLERDGQYWGPPPDDATALRELERLRRAGASHIVF